MQLLVNGIDLLQREFQQPDRHSKYTVTVNIFRRHHGAVITPPSKVLGALYPWGQGPCVEFACSPRVFIGYFPAISSSPSPCDLSRE